MLYLHKCNILLRKVFIKPGCNFTFTVHTSEDFTDTWICVILKDLNYMLVLYLQVTCRHTCMQINTLRKLSQLLYISRCYEAKIEESEKLGRQSLGIKSRTPGLCSQYSATEPRWPANHQPSQSSICTAAQVELKSLSRTGCEGWWLAGHRGSLAEHWLHKPGVLGSIPGDCRSFHFLYFRLVTSLLLYI